ncbi:MAG TPA: polysaccharide biosynthesis/export family protein [Verrucomicrobiae bacterium]|jgi:polysaccharide export outer membrane protein|nr:polysaccharide biosynthesis/export family protein [Verrucomicrobiae bacterium]
MKTRFWGRIGLSMAVLLFLAVSSAGAADDEGAKVDESYILQPGDKLNIKIYPEDEYLKGGTAEISSEGNITLPLLGKIGVAGKKVPDAENAIADLLNNEYIVNPQVVIEVLAYQASSFVVLGQVLKPGTYEFPPGSKKLTLLKAISLAGGFSDIANIKKIKIVRKSTGETLDANAEEIISGNSADIEIKANDIINVSESRF